MRNRFALIMLALMIALGLMASYPGQASATLTVDANHNHIDVDYNYNGSEVGVSGMSDPGVDLVVTIASEDAHQTLKEKNKVAGVLWMNTGDVNIEHVPNVYYLRSTGDPKEMLTAGELAAEGIGYGALLERAKIESSEGDIDRETAFAEFVKYKEANRLYSVSDGGIELSQQGETQDYRVPIDWPYQIPPGNYEVTVRAVRDGAVVERATTNVVVERAGVVKRLANMAQHNGALYGAVAIVIALIAGFGVGLIFGKGGGAH